MAVKCANCSSDAVYTVTYPTSKPVNYCLRDLPKHLRSLADQGAYPLAVEEKPAEPVEPVVVKKKAVKPTTVEDDVDSTGANN